MKISAHLLLAGLLLTGCSRQATLLPQGDHSFKVIGQASSLETAREGAEAEAVRTCRKTQEIHALISERTAVVDSTEPGGTQYRVIWHFNCVDRGY